MATRPNPRRATPRDVLAYGVYTEVEKTLIELERAPLVTDHRNACRLAVQER